MKGYLLLFLIALVTCNKKCNNFGSSDYSSKENTLRIICELLFENGYETSFVAGILGNVFHEASIGQFESSAYKDETRKPQFLKDMDELYEYASNYSGKFVYDDDVSLTELNELMEKLKADNWKKGKFGLGCIQWTADRTYTLVQLYNEECGNKEKITLDQAIAAEGKMIIKELSDSNSFLHVYKSWSDNTLDKDTAQAAYDAGVIVCEKYENPKDADSKVDERGNTAKAIYEIIIAAEKNEDTTISEISENINSPEKCQCYNDYIQNSEKTDEECSKKIKDFLLEKICPPNATEKEIEECKINYFCGDSEIKIPGNGKYINLSIFVILTFLIY